MINCAVIDDEPLARECIVDYIEKVDFLNLAGTGSNPLQLSSILEKGATDLIFLDIQMPIMTGISFLKSTKVKPMVIMTTAFPEYALDGYELDVLDYLVKPISFSRFFKSAVKAKDYYKNQCSDTSKNNIEESIQQDYFFIKCDTIYERIHFKNLEYIEALQNYIIIHCNNRKYTTLMTMKRIEKLLDKSKFLRIHKSYIVSVDHVLGVNQSQIILKNATLPLSRNYRSEVFSQLVSKSLWKK